MKKNDVSHFYTLIMTYCVVAAAGIILGLNTTACFVAILPCLAIYFAFLYHPKGSDHHHA